MEDFGLDRYPADMFHGAGKVILFSVIPVAYISYVPALIYLCKNTLNPLFFLAGETVIIVFLLCLLQFVWKRGIRRYEASGG